jgi:hypothetical protein
MKLRPALRLALTVGFLCLAPALLWGADPPDKGKGHRTHAKVKCAQEKWELTPNSLGSFPVLLMKTNALVDVDLRLAGVSSGQLAIVTARDGGNITAESANQGKGGKGGVSTGHVIRTRVQGGGRISFQFAYGASLHNQRVTVDVAGRQLVFEFHVHP